MIFHEQVMQRFSGYLQTMQTSMLGAVSHGLDPVDLMMLYADSGDYDVLLRAHGLLGQCGYNEIVHAPYEGRTVTLEAALAWNTPGGFCFPKYMRGRRPIDTAPKKALKKLQDWTDTSMEIACQFAYWELALGHLNHHAESVEEMLFYLPSLAFLVHAAKEGMSYVGGAIERSQWHGNGNDWNKFTRQVSAVEKKLRPKKIPRMDGWIIDASQGADGALTQWRMIADIPRAKTSIQLMLTCNDTKLPSPHTENQLIPML